MNHLRTALIVAGVASLTVAAPGLCQDDPCDYPGVLIVTDNGADATGGNPQHEIEAVYVGQPDPVGSTVLDFTLQMAELVDDPLELQPATTWRIFFLNPRDGHTYWVAMETCDALEIPSFSFGWVDPVSGINQGIGGATGTFGSDGFITISVNRNLFVADDGSSNLPPIVGTTLLNVFGDVRIFVGAQCSGLISQLDGTGAGTYQVVGECPNPTELCCYDDVGGNPVCEQVPEGTCTGLTNGQIVVDCVTCLDIPDPTGPCVLPGTLLATDGTGEVAPPGGPEQDIEAIYLAQALPPAGGNLTATMKVVSLTDDPAALPLNTIWRVKFINPRDGNVYFVQMGTCDATNIPDFSFGWIDPATPNINSGIGSATGTFAADGTISITVPLNLLVAQDGSPAQPPQPGDAIAGTFGETQLLFGALCSGGLLDLDESPTGIPYTVISACPELCCHSGGTVCETVAGGDCGPIFDGIVLSDCVDCTSTGITVEPVAPTALGLQMAGPNPFARSTQLRYNLPEAAHVHVAVYDVGGALVRTLVKGERQPAGLHTLSLERVAGGSELGAGVYWVRINAGGFEDAIRVIHLK